MKLSILLVFGLLMGGFTLTFLASWNIRLNLDAGAPADVQFFLPEVSWHYYALFTVLILAAFVLLLRVPFKTIGSG